MGQDQTSRKLPMLLLAMRLVLAPKHLLPPATILNSFSEKHDAIFWLVPFPKNVIDFAKGNFMSLESGIGEGAAVSKELGQYLVCVGRQGTASGEGADQFLFVRPASPAICRFRHPLPGYSVTLCFPNPNKISPLHE
jgi:hypothetical protein